MLRGTITKVANSKLIIEKNYILGKRLQPRIRMNQIMKILKETQKRLKTRRLQKKDKRNILIPIDMMFIFEVVIMKVIIQKNVNCQKFFNLCKIDEHNIEYCPRGCQEDDLPIKKLQQMLHKWKYQWFQKRNKKVQLKSNNQRRFHKLFKDQEDKDGKITIIINKTKEVIIMIIINRIIVIIIGTFGIIITKMKDFGKGVS